MEKMVLEVKEVTKKVKDRTLIDHLSFQIEEKEICGFVGPNGSGKTTLIRMIMGLIKPTSGEIYINGSSVRENRGSALRHVGAIVESPIFFPYMSGRKNLINLGRITMKTSGDVLKKKVEEVLKIVGLESRANDSVGTYSLGMKQRLGIAQALLGDPTFIILDEPSNGLDPVGIQQLRKIILQLNKEKNITFFVSSHLIRELELICSSWIMINDGKLVWKGKTDGLRGNDKDLEEVFVEMMTQ
ncbi:ABC transporter ATP-binding protein [Bacillus tropicus]|uniref:ABC transporter ATP-binding protein n=1 Tax=Bacillus TaxID=1386 RepID=UPI0008FE1699|nr:MULTISPECIES: ABC transporter ATP-binding protein [Bacillus]MCC1485867.1 ABC transporter ATP-binding protein [Bacillus tropicus]MDA1552542.1 ABC transporter ATP-binding protein [Bacillus cereus group sp. TH243-3LC]MDA1563201.1 ABC transporter ATP-binding protein [Bacillus cereus group sp. TH243-1LC]MDA1657358.1 ABC transporter ATP-binding protein [Bacillus cereus group sp. TH150LC]MDA1860408.1 ABC transporter ATP-binding protein [Bacillus cereus group sp. BY122LC]